MADDEDEDVVFENSVLYQHLRDVGFSEEEVAPEATASTIDSGGNISDRKQQYKTNKILARMRRYSPVAWMRNSLQDQRKQAVLQGGLHICQEVLKAGVLEDEDAAFLQNYSVSTEFQDVFHTAQTVRAPSRLGLAAVIGGIIAYLTSRLTGTAATKLSPGSLVITDIMASLFIIFVFFPMVLIALTGDGWRRWCQSQTEVVSWCLREVNRFRTICKKTVRLIQEMELVARGFTLISTQTPIARLEHGDLDSLRQCPELRKLIFLYAKDMLREARDATNTLIQKYPLTGEFACLSSYLAKIPLEKYGPCVMLEDEEELQTATDNYSLASIKAMVELCNLHMSEMLRRFALGCVLSATQYSNGIGAAEDILEGFTVELHHRCCELQQAFQMHKYSMLGLGASQEPKRSKALEQTPADKVYIAVHSLSLHLQAALRRVVILEEQAGSVCCATDGTLTSDLQEYLTSGLKVIKADLDACMDCCDESLCRVDRGNKTEQEVPVQLNMAEPPPVSDAKPPIPLFEIGDPVIQDQVFEAYTDEVNEETSDWGSELLLSDEEREKKKREKQEAVRVLKELKTVISARATDWEAREQRARQLMRAERGDQPTGDIQTDSCQVTEDRQREQCIEAHDIHKDTSPNAETDSEESQNNFDTEGANSEITQETSIDLNAKSKPNENMDAYKQAESDLSALDELNSNQSNISQVNDLNTSHTQNDNFSANADQNAMKTVDSEQDNTAVHTGRNKMGGLKFEDGSESDEENYERPMPPNLESLRVKLAQPPGIGWGLTSNVAALAAARSQQMALNVDTFGDSESSEEEKDIQEEILE